MTTKPEEIARVFKVGDRVRCVGTTDPRGCAEDAYLSRLKVGDEYTVTYVVDSYCTVADHARGRPDCASG